MGKIRILHTSDWHLGKRLGQNERAEEHQLFLDWLIKTVIQQKVDCIIVAGDIFDTGNPSNTALKLYYDFLWQVKNTHCKNVIIIGGNHDSATTLNAPKDLLKHLNVYVTGGSPENPSEQIIPLKDEKGNIPAVICAVPFLRDRDIRLSVVGETSEEREQRIREGIINHYQSLIPEINEYKAQGIPVIATGHLFAAGATASPDSEKEIHVGNLGQIGGAQFPEEFDYIALGHLHRPQQVNKMSHIRYSGSPIALSFSENEDNKVVLICDFDKSKLLAVEEFPVPAFIRLIRIKGDLEQVKAKLLTIENTDSDTEEVVSEACHPGLDPGSPEKRTSIINGLRVEPAMTKCMIEIQVETENFIFDLQEQLQTLIEDKPYIKELFIKQIRVRDIQGISEQITENLSLKDLNPISVFIKKCESEFGNEDFEDLKQTFKEALELMTDSPA